MFKKKPNIKPLAPLRSSDRRKIANQIIKDFAVSIPAPAQKEDDAAAAAEHAAEVGVRNSLLPESSLSAKFSTTAGPELATVTGTIYVGAHPEEGATGKAEQRPLWVKVAGEEMFPSVYTLWNNPTLLPILHTHPPVIEKIKTGADLMVPGLIGPPFPRTAKEGRLVAIASSESPTVPLAVGVCELDISTLHHVVGEKGKAVRIVHWVGDEIYNYGGAGGKVPEFLKWGNEEDEDLDEDLAEEMGGVKLEEDGEKQHEGGGKGKEKEVEVENRDDGGGLDTGGRDEIRELTAKEIDEAFETAAVYGIYHYREPDKASTLTFPMSSSLFLTTLVLPFLPPASNFPPHNLLQNIGHHPSLTLKKSSHKHAAKFLKHLDKKVLIKTKTRNGGEVVVMDVDFNDHAVQEFTPYRLPEAPKDEKKDIPGPTAATASEATAGSLKVVELFRPHGKPIKIFEELEAGTKDFYTPTDLKSQITRYIEKQELTHATNKRLVKLDPLLASTLISDSSREDMDILKLGHIKRDVLAEKFIKSCSPYYVVLKPSETVSSPGVKPRAGAPPKIQILVETRQGKKSVTKVSGLEPFGVDPKALAEALQKLCAGSASVGQLVGSSPKNPVMEVMVQGPQKDIVTKVLEKKGVAGKYVVVVDKTGGKKK
ncbi:hypothetical protein RUND412_006553 [Rhizina undulata]